jgi:hypothetical protein
MPFHYDDQSVKAGEKNNSGMFWECKEKDKHIGIFVWVKYSVLNVRALVTCIIP